LSRIEPPAHGSEIFDRTIKGLEAGLKVGDIATYGFVYCHSSDDAAEVMARADWRSFDCVPVKHDHRIVGVLERDQDLRGPAGGCMRSLDESLLVSSEEPLKGFIPLLVESPHRLVVQGTRIEGIVTRSDVHKLPVRLLAFALVTNLEMTMADLIVRRSTDGNWNLLLSTGRQRKVIEEVRSTVLRKFRPAAH
jgi:hypothetical protein